MAISNHLPLISRIFITNFINPNFMADWQFE